VNALLDGGAATGDALPISGGVYAYAINGTFDGATATLQILGPDGATYIATGADTTLTAAGVAIVELPDCKARVLIASAGGSTALDASLKLIRR
jgi:hypothetical protein